MRFDNTVGMTGSLSPLAEDVFLTSWVDELSENAIVTFNRRGGEVIGMQLRTASPFADFSFDYQDLKFEREPEFSS